MPSPIIRRNCVICVPLMRSNAAVPSSHRQSSSRRKSSSHYQSSSCRSIRPSLFVNTLQRVRVQVPGVVPLGPGVVRREYKFSGSLSYTFPIIPDSSTNYHAQSTQKYFQGLFESISFSYTFRACTRENPILSYTFVRCVTRLKIRKNKKKHMI